MNATYYQMEKAAWDAKRGEYSGTEKITGKLTLKQVQGRVKRLKTIQSRTISVWKIMRYEVDGNGQGNDKLIGWDAAEDFVDDVPIFDAATRICRDL